ncbi:MAG: hypothetical protein Kow0063_35990 [Anaerolineae bacterium]
MSAPHNHIDREEKLALLRQLIESEDLFQDNQATFQAYLADPDPEVRSLAIRGLWDYPDPALIDTFIDIIEHDPDQSVRNRAISALGRYVYEGEMADYDFDWGAMEDIMREGELPEASYRQVLAFLLDIARDPAADLDARRFSIEALGFSSEPAIARLIEQAYHDPHLDMKVSALFAMGRSGLERWDPYILAELDSPEPRLQLEAVRAAGELFLDEAAPALIHLAQTATDPTLRHEAIWALAHTTSLEAWQLLDDIANDPTEDKETRELAEAALDEFEMFQGMDEAGYEEDEFDLDMDDGGNGYFVE